MSNQETIGREGRAAAIEKLFMAPCEIDPKFVYTAIGLLDRFLFETYHQFKDLTEIFLVALLALHIVIEHQPNVDPLVKDFLQKSMHK